jgi:hypothetical protein
VGVVLFHQIEAQCAPCMRFLQLSSINRIVHQARMSEWPMCSQG